MTQLRGAIPLATPQQREFQEKVQRIITAKRDVEITLKDQAEPVTHKDVQVSAEGLFYVVITDNISEIYRYPANNIVGVKETLTQ